MIGGENHVGITDYVQASRLGLAMTYGMPETGGGVMRRWFQCMTGRCEYQNTTPPSVIAVLLRGWQA
jgi:hypothetical protein